MALGNRRVGVLCCLLVLIAASGVFAGDACVSVKSFGAVGDGKTKDTKAIQKAIDSCFAGGGGTVLVPAGTYLSGPIFLKSNITLRIDSGAKLLGSRDWEDYPVVKGRWEGIECEHKAALITGRDLENVAVVGRGTVDGQGDAWWGDYKRYNKLFISYQAKGITSAPKGEEKDWERAFQARYPRPRLINLINCKNVVLRDLTLQNSPSWTVHPVYCENVVIDSLTVKNPDDSPNTDGIDPDSCRMVRITNCYISVGDDCITIKAGKDKDGLRVNRPCEQIAIANCIMGTGHGGVVIGSETSGGVRDVSVSNCVFVGTERGIRLKTQRGRGGVIENLSYDNIVMRGFKKEAILLTMFYNGGADEAKMEPVNEGTPVFRNISVSNIRAEGASSAIVLEGLPEMPISGLSFSNIRINSTRGIKVLRAKDVRMENVSVTCREGPLVTVSESEDLVGFTKQK